MIAKIAAASRTARGGTTFFARGGRGAEPPLDGGPAVAGYRIAGASTDLR